MSQSLFEPAREVPIIGEYDLCVLGGSCTGLFAAIRAARLGLTVAVVERMGCFGGVATISMVNVWHSAFDEAFKTQIFSGLTTEVMERLKKRQAVREYGQSRHAGWIFNSAELQIELDELVRENRVVPWLHTAFVAPHLENGELQAVIVENKSGRGAIRARFFIDATGDGDLCHRLGLTVYGSNRLQPATTCALFSGWNTLEGIPWPDLIREHGADYGLPEGFAWDVVVPNSNLSMLAGTRVHEDCSDAEGLSRAEMEGRRQVRAIQDILRKHAPSATIALQALPARIGIRQTRHVQCLHQVTGDELLHGHRFPDAIANGSYSVDIHHAEKPGITLKWLDGTQLYSRPGHPPERGRWRPETPENPTFYQIPYRSLIPQGPYGNLLAAGRFIDADPVAHGAIRVMVNLNQTGEAAGTAAFLALRHGIEAKAVDARELRNTLADGGSIML